MCKPGYYSLNGLVPCSPCALGSYTDTIKAKQCKRCPDNKSTEQSGSSHATDCISKFNHKESQFRQIMKVRDFNAK